MVAEHSESRRGDAARRDLRVDDAAIRLKVRDQVSAALGLLDDVSLRPALRALGDVRGLIDAVEARRLAAEVGADGDTRAASSKAGSDRRVSKRSARAAGKRAKAVKKNPKLGDKLADGSLSSEQLDTIANAMDTDESAATDEALIDRVADSSADQGRQHGRNWAAKRASADEKQSEHDRQRAGRRAATWKDHRTDLSALKLEGDDASIDELWKLIQAEERRLYLADGGRDVPLSKHPRTRDQRRFDAAVAVLLGEHGDSDRPGGLRNAAGRPAAVLDIDVTSLEPDADRCAELVGHGPIADSVAAELLARSELFVNLHFEGRTLWYGRTKRNAPRDLFIALVVRDRGCVRCGADWQKCQAHHLMPWHARGRGETNIDNMALLCNDCHTQLHANNHTLYRGLDNNWHTRPDTPNETPPAGRRQSARRRSRHSDTSTSRASVRPDRPDEGGPDAGTTARHQSSADTIADGHDPGRSRHPGSRHRSQAESRSGSSDDDDAATR